MTSHLSIYIKMGVQMFVCFCLLLCGGLIEIQTPTSILMKFSTYIPSCQRKVLVQVWPPPPPPGPRGLETLKAEGHILRSSAGCKLTWAAPGTSASIYIYIYTSVPSRRRGRNGRGGMANGKKWRKRGVA